MYVPLGLLVREGQQCTWLFEGCLADTTKLHLTDLTIGTTSYTVIEGSSIHGGHAMRRQGRRLTIRLFPRNKQVT